MEQGILTLPIQATGRVDIGRLLHEVEQIDSFLKQAAIREPGTTVKMPKTSRLLDEFATSNKLNLLQDDDRARVLNFLIAVKAKAPVLHMSFSVDPSPMFVQKLMTWLRAEIHPLVLMQVGLQPNIGAGCVVRGTNKYFDFSLREHFKKQRPLLIEKLHGDMQQAAPAKEEAPSAQTESVQPPESVSPDPQTQTAPETPEQLAKEVEAQIADLDPAKQASSPSPEVQATAVPQPPKEAPHA